MKTRRRSRTPVEPADASWHGTAGGYSNHECGCDPCHDAMLVDAALQRAARYARGLLPGDPRHGTPNGYGNWRCPCEACREAWNRAQRERAQGRATSSR